MTLTAKKEKFLDKAQAPSSPKTINVAPFGMVDVCQVGNFRNIMKSPRLYRRLSCITSWIGIIVKKYHITTILYLCMIGSERAFHFGMFLLLSMTEPVQRGQDS
jgi:hypothetical protein